MPWRAETFKFSADPQLAAKVQDVVGLYLHPPERAVVRCVDEKSQIQALQRTQPVRRIWPGRPEQRTHDDVRHGTTTLFARAGGPDRRVIDQCAPRHRHQEFLVLLKQIARAYPRRQLHSIVERQAPRRGGFASVSELTTAISRFCAALEPALPIYRVAIAP